MIDINLHNVKFYAFHGIFPEEKNIGGEYIVDISVTLEEIVNIITRLQESVNYTELFNIAKEHMSIPTPLIETVAMQIGQSIHVKYPNLKQIIISIKKLNPPIINFQGSVGVSWHKIY